MNKSSTEKFIEKSNKIHNNKYDYSLVEYIDSKTKIKIICPIHNIFEQSPNGHLNGQGCPICNGGIKSTTESFIKKAKQIHGDKYDYSLLNYINSNTKVKIICKEHGEFYQYPGHHINRKYGCPKCSNRYNYNSIEFMEKAKQIHGDRYDYSLINYKNNYTKVKIICPIHGIFEQKPNDHLNNHGCPNCIGRFKTSEQFIHQSNIIHNNKYNYSSVEYKNNRIKVKIICPIHGIFEQKPNDHLNNHGCPSCNESKGEKIIKEQLEKYNINFEIQKTFDNCKNKYKLKFDFYLPDYNLCIEFDGEQHFKPIKHFGGEKGFQKLKINDNIKNEYCKNNNIKLLRISYIEDIDKKLKKLLTTNKQF